jgi:enediyne biosynthesis protein E4
MRRIDTEFKLLLIGMIGWMGVSWLLGTVTLGAADYEWQEGEGFRSRALEVPKQGKVGFTRLTEVETGIGFTNILGEWEGATNRVLYNGSGVAVGDFNGDGRPDLYFCGLSTPNVLFENLGGFKFRRVLDAAGATGARFDRGAVFADLNGDGWDDLLVSTLANGVRCYLNDGQGRLVDRTTEAGTGSPWGASSMALADIDGDGTLDLYVANYRSSDIRDQGEVTLQVVGGKIEPPPQYRGRLEVRDGVLYEYGEPDQVLLNDGRGRFTELSWTNGAFRDESGTVLTGPPRDWGLTATFRDLTGNGLPDIYVCNDYWTPDRVWINQGQGKFRALEQLALRNTSASSMGMDFADLDRDGDVDGFVLDMLSRDPRLRKRQKIAQMPEAPPVGMIDDRPQFMRNTLLENRGDGTYREVAWHAGVAASDWSWSTLFLDVDLDGYEDLLIAAGHFKDVQDMDVNMLVKVRQRPRDRSLSPEERRRQFSQELLEHHRLYPRLEMPVIAFRNRGDGTFEELTQQWGTEELGVHHSIAFGDLDGDGDLDFVTNTFEGNAGVYRNDSTAPRVAVRLRGTPPNTRGIGATVRLLGGAVPMQSQEMVAGGRYLAGAEPLLVFAAGGKAGGMTIEVAWRSGKRSVVAGVQANRLYEIEEAGAMEDSTMIANKVTTKSATTSGTKDGAAEIMFLDVSGRLNHKHHELAFDDFARQPLLPFKLSQAGPGLGWFDLNSDGHEDLIVGAGQGGAISVFLGDGRGGFRAAKLSGGWVAPDDLTACLGWHLESGQAALLAGVSGYEVPGAAAVVEWVFEDGALRTRGGAAFEALPEVLGPLALGDLDGDGDLDLFVGSGSLPGHYPMAGASVIYRRADSKWVRDAENSAVVAGAGIVNGAVWSDLTGDGYPELVLACEWGPVRVYRNQGGRLREITDELGLSPYLGWWRGVTTGDLDGDGRLDIVAGNWGLNSPFRASHSRPFRIFHGDFLGSGRQDLIETEYDPVSGAVVPSLDFNAYAPSLPFLYDHYRSFRQFSESTVPRMLGEYLGRAKQVIATTFESIVFYNAQPRFRVEVLPRAAQLAPAFGVTVADFDGDGVEDLFFSQNFFATRPELNRLDAGRGLWLKGDGRGGWIEAEICGIAVYGEQRAAALADFDQDGRMDLAVTQNGAQTKLYRNQGARPGVRVRLVGPPANPRGVGAVVRLKYGEKLGPARAIHGGSGYWSQDSATLVLHPAENATGVWVRWPGGRETTRDLTGRDVVIKVGDR